MAKRQQKFPAALRVRNAVTVKVGDEEFQFVNYQDGSYTLLNREGKSVPPMDLLDPEMIASLRPSNA